MDVEFDESRQLGEIEWRCPERDLTYLQRRDAVWKEFRIGIADAQGDQISQREEIRNDALRCRDSSKMSPFGERKEPVFDPAMIDLRRSREPAAESLEIDLGVDPIRSPILPSDVDQAFIDQNLPTSIRDSTVSQRKDGQK